MRMLTLGVALAAGALLVLWVALGDRGAGARSDVRPAGERPAAEPARPLRDVELERRIAALELELAALRSELRALADSTTARTVPVLEQPDDELPVEGDERSPEWYLEQYLASFRDGGRGSEYFRLAVEAYAPALLARILPLVKSAGTLPALRWRLVEILGDARFAGSSQVQDALLAVLRTSDDAGLLARALASYEAIGDARATFALESLVWRLPAKPLQLATVQTIVRLAGDEANAALLRLLAGAPAELQPHLIASLAQTDDASALEAFRFASRGEVPLRLQAAQTLPSFRAETFRAFVDEWLSWERDESVRQALQATRTALDTLPAYHPEQATGPPDADPPTNDHPKAWATKTMDGGAEWLELGYDRPLRVTQVRIHEVCCAGAVSKVIGIEKSGERRVLWEGVDPTTTPGVFELQLARVSPAVTAVRIELDTTRRSGWNEIDAVELVGPDGRAWASSARASSSYANR